MKRLIAAFLVLILVLPLTGCWNAREINELAFVLSIGLDKSDNGYKVTAQIAKPETYSKTTTGGTSGMEKEKPFWLVSSTGKTIFEAVRNMASVSSRRIFWSHIKVIILGEDLARSNIREIFDYFSRNPELRFRTWIAVAPGEAGKILEVVPIMEKDPSQNIEKLMEKVNLTGKSSNIMLKDFLQDYLNPYLNPVATRIILTELDSKPVVKLEGAAAFGDNNLVGWLNEQEARGFLWIKNNVNSSIRVVNCPFDNIPATLEIKTGKTKITSTVVDGIPNYTINAEATAKLTEKGCITEFTDPENLHALEKALAATISDDIAATVTAAQRMNTDILDFSGVLHRQHKKEWDSLSKDWSKLYPKVKVKIEVKASIPEVSLLAKSLVPVKSPDGKTR